MKAFCNKCHAPKGIQAVGESCNQNCGGRVVFRATLATPANMGLFETQNPTNKRAVAYSPTTGETYSADSGDYFYMEPDDLMIDSEGSPMLLVVAVEAVEMLDAMEFATKERQSRRMKEEKPLYERLDQND